MTKITRRSALFGGVALGGLNLGACTDDSPKYKVAFHHGVASGDPTHNSVILWSRITPEQDGPLTVHWQISENPEFRKKHGLAKHGKTTTSAARDYTVKVDATGLKPGTTYYYRFLVGKTVSPVGRTRTLPKGRTERARLAVVSCSNYPFGYFNVYDHIAKQDGIDVVVHLGDYFYEYGRDGYGGKTGRKLGREHEPAHEVVTLADYRARHAQYKADTASQAVHAAHPFICIWDDHETANNSWKTGAENHGADEGSWDDRRAAAMQAYYEWMPVRDPVPGRPREALYRAFEFGDLFSLDVLETRLTARSRQIDYAQYIDSFKTRAGVEDFVKNILWDRDREMLGADQRRFLAERFQASRQAGKPWRLIANQVIMGEILSPDLRDFEGTEAIEKIARYRPSIRKFVKFSPLGLPINLDAWDGYPAARERFYGLARKAGVEDLLVLTGDTHVSWLNGLRAKDGTPMGLELGVTGVTSPGHNAYFKELTGEFERRLVKKNRDMHFVQSAERGYIDLKIGRKTARADFVSVSTTHSPDYKAHTAKSFEIAKSGKTLKARSV